jgi:hypothetical protein
LHSKGYNSHWYNYWANLLRVKAVGDSLHHPGNFSEWIKNRFAATSPSTNLFTNSSTRRETFINREMGQRDSMHVNRWHSTTCRTR